MPLEGVKGGVRPDVDAGQCSPSHIQPIEVAPRGRQGGGGGDGGGGDVEALSSYL